MYQKSNRTETDSNFSNLTRATIGNKGSQQVNATDSIQSSQAGNGGYISRSNVMYTHNNVKLNWKQAFALVVLALFAWQIAFTSAYAQSATSQLAGHVFAGSTQQGRVINVDMSLLDTSGDLLATTTTDASGAYSFDVSAGSYLIENGMNGATLPTTVTDDMVMVGLDFYNSDEGISSGLQVSSPSSSQVIGYVFSNDGTNIRLVNAQVELLYPDGTAVLDANGQPASATTNANGSYTFNVTPGTYLLHNVLNDEMLTVSIADNIVMVGMDFYNASAAVSASQLATLATSQLVGYLFAGSTQQGRVGNIDVNLLDAKGSLLATTTTDVNGSYTFDVPAGSYIIENTANGDSLPTTVTDNMVMVGLDFYDAAPSDSDVSTGLQVGLPTTSQIIGYVFGGTTQDVRLVNTDVALLYPNGTAVLDAGGQPMIATTNASGSYSFDVIAGTYLLHNTINDDSLMVTITDDIVMVGMDFYGASISDVDIAFAPTANVPLAISLSNVSITNSAGSLMTAIVLLVIVTASAPHLKTYTEK